MRERSVSDSGRAQDPRHERDSPFWSPLPVGEGQGEGNPRPPQMRRADNETCQTLTLALSQRERESTSHQLFTLSIWVVLYIQLTYSLTSP